MQWRGALLKGGQDRLLEASPTSCSSVLPGLVLERGSPTSLQLNRGPTALECACTYACEVEAIPNRPADPCQEPEPKWWSGALPNPRHWAVPVRFS